MELRDRRILAKIREEARLVSEFIDGAVYDEFKQNEKTKRAVSQTLANIGELCHALSDDVKTKYENVPWAAIRKTRNITHAYESFDFKYMAPFLIPKSINNTKEGLPCLFVGRSFQEHVYHTLSWIQGSYTYRIFLQYLFLFKPSFKSLKLRSFEGFECFFSSCMCQKRAVKPLVLCHNT